MIIRPYAHTDRLEWQRMRDALWPGQTAAEMQAWLARPDATVVVADRGTGTLGGFVEVGARSIADGCDSSPVGYIEGWWVDADCRRTGVGAALIHAAETWARGWGYSELASDTETHNTVSQTAHEHLGFTELDRVVTYRKSL
jgi:aminoglycoside 6'-N-acetyltransferase I